MSVIRCARARADLTLFVGGDLTPDQDRAVREHLAACPRCRAEFGRWLTAHRALLDAVGAEQPPAGQPMPSAAFFATLERDVLGAVAAAARTPARKPRVLPKVVAAAALFAVGLGLSQLAVGGSDAAADAELLVPPASPTRPISIVAPGLSAQIQADRMVSDATGLDVLEDELDRSPGRR